MGAKEKQNQTIIIIGGGLAGLACSLGLSKLGYDIHIIENRKTWLQQGSAFGLAANARKALKELFHDADDDDGSSNPEATMEKITSKGIYIEASDSYLLVWGIVRDVLLEEVKKCSNNISIHMGKTISWFDDVTDPSKVEVTLNDVDDPNIVEKLDAVLVIAADGVYSTMRGLMGLEPSKFATITKWRGALTVPEGSILEQFLDKGISPLRMDESTIEMTKGNNCVLSLFNFHPKVERKMTFVMNAYVVDIPHGTHPREMFRQHMIDPYHQSIMEEIYKLGDEQELTWPLAMAVIELPEEEVGKREGWGGKGRVTLIGDSAHAMRPASGLGGAMAFEDAVVLCRLLKDNKDLLQRRGTADELVRKFESSRFERVKILWDNQWQISESVYKKGADVPGTWSPEFREWVCNGV